MGGAGLVYLVSCPSNVIAFVIGRNLAFSEMARCPTLVCNALQSGPSPCAGLQLRHLMFPLQVSASLQRRRSRARSILSHRRE
jgi:hypothetical protein